MPIALNSSTAAPASDTASAMRGVSQRTANAVISRGNSVIAQNTPGGTGRMALPSSTVCVALASTSTPLIVREGGVAKISDTPEAVAPISTSLPANASGGTRPFSTSSAGTCRYVPAGPAKFRRICARRVQPSASVSTSANTGMVAGERSACRASCTAR